MTACIHVAAAAIFNDRGQVLISRRPDHLHQGGLWEFPGGKLEPGESINSALRRELHEELGIAVRSARPLIRVHHDYPDRQVLLDVWRVDQFEGLPHGREGQPVAWVSPDGLGRYRFPAANAPITKAVALPERYLITPEPGDHIEEFLSHLKSVISRGVSLVQLRAKQLSEDEYSKLALQAIAVCRQANARLLLNAEPSLARELGADGVHLSSERLMRLTERPLESHYLLGGSCHSAAELMHACSIGLDFVVVSPVRETTSHPGASALGLEGLRALTEQADLPVYALGGMREGDLQKAFESGAQGIAAIRSLWG